MPGQRRHISDEVKNVIVTMSTQAEIPLTRKEIRALTGVAESTQRRINALYRRTGQVSAPPAVNGRSRTLNAMDVSFLEGLMERRPDITFNEMKKVLREVCNVEISKATLSRTLKQLGFTRKKVHYTMMVQSGVDASL
ncbi:hypothetical protein PAXINDRAFT_77660 [Paxillus involutus ATCC 200175]|uniref:Transposase Tc1-like domain-containing protein n=1 Tax=Paxillus involutus ATCC 200175 TaxID=664439 RepID=A0A0C9THS4_PAXIN|nr:hypothetical protein PAXINDRAFT_77660 [Paxillus involutus ATCC 200175]